METFAEFFKYGEPVMKLPELEVKMPVGALALAVTAVISISLIFHLSSVHLLVGRACSYFISRRLSRIQGWYALYKKRKVLDKRALKGAADNSIADNDGPIFKEIRPVKLDFSTTNFKAKVTGWRLSIENKVDALFPTVCDTARGIAGIDAAAVGVTQLEHQDPQILARANLVSEDEDSAADLGSEHEKNNTQANDEDLGDKFDEHCDNGGDNNYHDNNGVDDGSSDVDEDHTGNNGGGDSDGHDNEGDNSDGHNNEGNNRVDSEEDENNSGPNGKDSDGGDYDNDHNDETEEENYSWDSDLTEIGSSSEIVEIVSAPGSHRKRVVQRGRR